MSGSAPAGWRPWRHAAMPVGWVSITALIAASGRWKIETSRRKATGSPIVVAPRTGKIDAARMTSRRPPHEAHAGTAQHRADRHDATASGFARRCFSLSSRNGWRPRAAWAKALTTRTPPPPADARIEGIAAAGRDPPTRRHPPAASRLPPALRPDRWHSPPTRDEPRRRSGEDRGTPGTIAAAVSGRSGGAARRPALSSQRVIRHGAAKRERVPSRPARRAWPARPGSRRA